MPVSDDIIKTRRGSRVYGFTPIQGSGARIRDEAGPYLEWLARTFPQEFLKALRKIGWNVRKGIKNAIANGQAGGTVWEPLSHWQRQRTFDAMKSRGRVLKSGKWSQAGKRGYKRSGPFYGKLFRAIAYKVYKSSRTLRIGFLGHTAASWAEALGGGKRGTRRIFQYAEQPVTPAMRRMFAAAGHPLKKSTRTIGTPRREVIEPYWRDAVRNKVPRAIELHILDMLRGAKRKARLS